MGRITSYEQVEKLHEAGKLTAAEKTLIRNCQLGEPTVVNGNQRPDAPSDGCKIDAELLRFLILGGDTKCPVDPTGIQLAGAFVSGHLSLDFTKANGRTSLTNCRFSNLLSALQTRFEMLDLSGSAVPGFFGQGSKTEGDVFLRDKFHAKGEISLSGARIGGQLDCSDGTFENGKEMAIFAQGLKVTESLNLSGEFQARGQVSLYHAEIGGALDCSGGRFERRGDTAIDARGVTCAELGWWNIQSVRGAVKLNGARIGRLMDDAESWDKPDSLSINGMKMTGLHGFTDLKGRLNWLRKGAFSGDEFHPQPYEEFARVLRDIGHAGDARRVLVEKERLKTRARRDRVWTRRRIAPAVGWRGALRAQWVDLGFWAQDFALWLWDWLVDWLVGYGLFPQKVLIALSGLLLVATLVFHQAYARGDFAPNAPVVLLSEDWQRLANDDSIANPAEVWSAQQGQGRDYETFNRYAYAADVVIPIIDLGQEAAWAPSTTRGDWGKTAWWARWVLTLTGWFVTAVGVAAIGGLIRRE